MQFISATSLDAALDALAENDAHTRILAGGTDLMLQLARAELDAECLVHIEGLRPQLSEISYNEEGLRIGALATHDEIARHKDIRSHYSSLAHASSTVGGWQTQSIGTIGGNVCNASPAADTLPPLLVHGAKVELVSKKRGLRSVGLGDFLIGRRKTGRRTNELLVAITLDRDPPRTADSYQKVGRRKAMEVAIAGLALRCTMEKDLKTVSDIRIATCAVGPVPTRATKAEKIILGERLSDETIAKASRALSDQSSPIDDVRSSSAYRRKVLPRLLAKGLLDCAEMIVSAAEQEATRR